MDAQKRDDCSDPRHDDSPAGRCAALVVGLLVGLVLLATGCANRGQKLPDSRPVPQGITWEGVWYSPQFEHMFLRREGDTVVGVYSYKTGGRLEGTIDGNLMKFKWVDPGFKEHARQGMSGHGYFQLVREDGEPKLIGEWGYNEDRTGAGPWNADWVRKIEREDPGSVKELRNTSESDY